MVSNREGATTDGAGAHDDAWRGGNVLALIAISTADFLVVMEGFIVAVALPALQDELKLSQTALQWVFTAYALTFGGFLLLGGRLGDLYGRRRVLVCGFACFAIGSLLAGMAPAGAVLIVGRAVQGLGAAAMTPAALALLTATFSAGRSRNTALAVWSAVGSVGIPAGALIGGLLTQAAGWRWVLLINAPAALLAAGLARVVLAESRDLTALDTDGRPRLDVTGGVLVTTGLAALIAAVTATEQLAAAYAGEANGSDGLTLALVVIRLVVPLLVAAALLTGFVIVERRREQHHAEPLVRLSIFRTPGLISADLAAAALPVGLGALLFLGTQYLQRVLGFSPWETSIAYLSLAMPTIAASPVAARLVQHFGRRRVAVAGLLLQAAGLIWLVTALGAATAAPSGSASETELFLAGVLPAFVLVGAGAPIAYVPVTGAAVEEVSEAAGLASGLFNGSQQVGNALAIALMATATAIGSTLAVPAAASSQSGDPLLAGLRLGLGVAAGLCLIAALAAGRLRRQP